MDRVRVGGILADGLQVIKLVDDVLGILNEVLALVREGDALVGARDEGTPQFIFQIADRLGEIWLGHEEIRRSLVDGFRFIKLDHLSKLINFHYESPRDAWEKGISHK